MSDKPNPSDFSCNERDGEYTVYVRASGRISLNIKAVDEHDCRRQAEAEIAKMEQDGFIELDDIDLMEVWRIHKDPRMYRVIRDGQPMQVSVLEPGDLPRPADPRGF